MIRLKSYKGLNVLVSGASSGIGRVLARRLAAEGAQVALVARRSAELEKLATQIRERGGKALALPCDVADADQVARCSAQALEHFGGIDLLVNNAGYGHHRRFLDWDLADMERVMRVNYLGALYFTKALLPQMVERGRGWLVFIASVAGKIASPEETAYVASKFAMVGLAEALSLEVEDAGVHVLTVCPGVIRTPFFDEEALERMPPVSRRTMVEPEALIDAILKVLARGKREITYREGSLPPTWSAHSHRRSCAVWSGATPPTRSPGKRRGRARCRRTAPMAAEPKLRDSPRGAGVRALPASALTDLRAHEIEELSAERASVPNVSSGSAT